ncbi:Uncharacterised protein [Mycobacteroides abscessus subsp. abscessus]|nr:Uncharacterised protein [Mycobacteroides abscessus subsp. abscessus]
MVPQRALGSGQHGVVIGQHGACAAVSAEQIAVDACGPGHQSVCGCAGDQVGEFATAALCGNGESSVFHERSGIHQIGDIFARGATAGRMAACNRIGASGVLCERTSR